MHVSTIPMHSNVCLIRLQMYLSAYVDVRNYVHMRIHICVYIQIRTYIYTYAYMYVYMRGSTHEYV